MQGKQNIACVEILARLQSIASQSSCLDRKVGCILERRSDGLAVATGYNKTRCTTKCAKFAGLSCIAEHAEQNAAHNYRAAFEQDDDWPELAAYVSYQPCDACLTTLRNINVTYLTFFEKSGAVMTVPNGMTVHYTPCTLIRDEIGMWDITLQRIRRYHEDLGYPDKNGDKYTQARELLLALHQEVSELTDSIQWKPWRLARNFTRHNFLEEMADVLIFLDSLLMNFDCNWRDVRKAIEDKLKVNYKRIEGRYHK